MSCGQAALQFKQFQYRANSALVRSDSKLVLCDMEAQKSNRIETVLFDVHLPIVSLVKEESRRWMTAWRH